MANSRRRGEHENAARPKGDRHPVPAQPAEHPGERRRREAEPEVVAGGSVTSHGSCRFNFSLLPLRPGRQSRFVNLRSPSGFLAKCSASRSKLSPLHRATALHSANANASAAPGNASRVSQQVTVRICTNVEAFPQTLGGNLRTRSSHQEDGRPEQNVKIAPKDDRDKPPRRDARRRQRDKYAAHQDLSAIGSKYAPAVGRAAPPPRGPAIEDIRERRHRKNASASRCRPSTIAIDHNAA